MKIRLECTKFCLTRSRPQIWTTQKKPLHIYVHVHCIDIVRGRTTAVLSLIDELMLHALDQHCRKKCCVKLAAFIVLTIYFPCMHFSESSWLFISLFPFFSLRFYTHCLVFRSLSPSLYLLFNVFVFFFVSFASFIDDLDFTYFCVGFVLLFM